MIKKLFVTGEVGCLAKYLECFLPDDSYSFVWSYSNRDESICRFKSTWNEGHELDVCDYQLLRKTIKEANPDIVIHTAGIVDTVLCESRPFDSYSSNGYGAYNVAKICHELGKKLVFFSTTAIFDPNDYHGGLINDTTKIDPQTIYGITKYSGELTCRRLIKDLVIVRPCFVYGGIEDGHSSIARLIRGSLENRKIKVLLSGEYKKDYMRVEDLVSAIDVLLKQDVVGDFNISFGAPRTFKGIMSIIENVIGSPLLVDLFPEEDYLKSHIVENHKMKSLGWVPKIGLKEGIEKSYFEIKNSMHK